LGLAAVAAISVAGSTGASSVGLQAGSTNPRANLAAMIPPVGPASARPTASTSATASDAATPSPTPTATPTPYDPYPVTNIEPLPPCTFGDQLTPLAKESDWELTLVDTDLAVPESYVPDDLVPASQAGLSPYDEVRSVMIPDLRSMASAAAAAQAPLGIASSYRDYSTQSWTFWFWVAQEGYDLASHDSARPGHSEHQLGLAIDFTEPGGADPWTYLDWARDDPAGKWLASNAWRVRLPDELPKGARWPGPVTSTSPGTTALWAWPRRRRSTRRD
jgi:LAS superfamily LD-carboxypeptidase LdcB